MATPPENAAARPAPVTRPDASAAKTSRTEAAGAIDRTTPDSPSSTVGIDKTGTVSKGVPVEAVKPFPEMLSAPVVSPPLLAVDSPDAAVADKKVPSHPPRGGVNIRVKNPSADPRSYLQEKVGNSGSVPQSREETSAGTREPARVAIVVVPEDRASQAVATPKEKSPPADPEIKDRQLSEAQRGVEVRVFPETTVAARTAPTTGDQKVDNSTDVQAIPTVVVEVAPQPAARTAVAVSETVFTAQQHGETSPLQGPVTELDFQNPELLDLCSRKLREAISSTLIDYSSHDIEDLVQDGLIRLMKKRDIKDLGGYVYIVGRNLARDLNKSGKRRIEVLEDFEKTDVLHNPTDSVDLQEIVVTQSTIQHALSQLSERERTVFTLVFWGGLAKTQIAEKLGMPYATVNSLQVRGLRKMRKILTSGDNSSDGIVQVPMAERRTSQGVIHVREKESSSTFMQKEKSDLRETAERPVTQAGNIGSGNGGNKRPESLVSFPDEPDDRNVNITSSTAEQLRINEEQKWAQTIQHIFNTSPGDIRAVFGRVLTLLRLAEEPEPLQQREFIAAKQFEGYTYSAYQLLESGDRIPHLAHLRMIVDKSIIKDLDPQSTAMQLLFLYASNAAVPKESPPNLPMSKDTLRTCSLWDLVDYFARLRGLTTEEFANEVGVADKSIKRHKRGESKDPRGIVSQIKKWLGPKNAALQQILDQKVAISMTQNVDEVPEIPERVIDDALEEGFIFAPQVETIDASIRINEESVNAQLQAAMSAKDMSEADLAQRAGVNPRSVQRIIRGDTTNPQPIVRFKLFKSLGYKTHDPEMLDFLFAAA